MTWLLRFNPFYKKNKGVQYLLSLDIGTEFVKALIFKTEGATKEGEIIGAGKVHQPRGNMQSAAVADIPAVTEICRQAIAQAKQMAGRKEIDGVVVGIAGEYVRGTATTLVYQRQNAEEKIDLPELKNIVQRIQWQAFNKIRQKLAQETNISEIDVKLINAAIVDVKIDGYQVTNPVGFQGKELSLTIFNVYAPLVHLGAIESIVNALKLNLVSIAAEPYAVVRSVDLKNKQNSAKGHAIIIDIGGGTSDLALVRNGAIEGVKSIAIGGQAFTKRLGLLLGLSFQQAEEIKLKYSQGEVGRVVKRKITDALKKDFKIWASGLSLILEEFSQAGPLPSTILLCGGGSFLPGIKKILEDPEWTKGLPFAGENPQVSFIRPQDISGLADLTGSLDSCQDVASMALASLAIEMEKDKETILGPIVKRTVRLMQT